VRTVLILALVCTAGCATPAKERPAGLAPVSANPASVSQPVPSTGPVPATASVAPVGAAGAPPLTTTATAAESTTGSAYIGCGQPIPLAKLWDETLEPQVLEAISLAKACAREHGRRLLLEFVAPWCEDCQEMAKLDETAAVSAVLQSRFERVRVNVGKWDRHEALRKNFDVHALATYIVIDPKTSQVLAKTTLEPITKQGQKISAEQWARWLRTH
jgi:thiol-disulfide isomerase/thioredoxin